MDFRDPDWVREKLGLDRNTVYKFLQDGTLPAVQLGRKWLISESNLERWLLEETDRQTRARQAATASQERTVARIRTLSPAARAVLRAAFAEARRYNHRHLGQEHLLLGLAADPQSTTARALGAFKLDLDTLRADFERRLAVGDGPPPRRMGRMPRTRKAMRLAAVEARAAGCRLVEPEHLLLGLLLARDGVGYEMLADAGVTLEQMRNTLTQEKS